MNKIIYTKSKDVHTLVVRGIGGYSKGEIEEPRVFTGDSEILTEAEFKKLKKRSIDIEKPRTRMIEIVYCDAYDQENDIVLDSFWVRA